MAVRRWSVHPDLELHTQSQGVVPMVSREKLVDAILDGVALLDRSGGGLTVTVGRHPTDLPGEAITTGAIVEWRSGPRAPADTEGTVDVTSQLQPPAPAAAVEPPAPPAAVEPEPEPVTQAEVAGLQQAATASDDDVGDGLVVTEDEDVSELEGATV